MKQEYIKWGILHRSENKLDGKREFLGIDIVTSLPRLFSTRALARSFQQAAYGYIHHRPDLHKEPHGWKSPKVVKVRCTFEPIESVRNNADADIREN